MSLLAESISAIVSVRIKRRHDSFTDQYNRLFMVKMCILSSAIIGFNYFSDKVSCIVANGNGMGDGFVGSACWIQGFYVFEEMKERLGESGYYGIPKNMDYDGINALGHLCSTTDRANEYQPSCTPMSRRYYLQYQYFPFITASFSLLFYIPYILYKLGNSDMVSFKEAVKDKDLSNEELFRSFFDRRINNQRRMRYRSFVGLVVKILYLLANVIAFVISDALLNHDFQSYGRDYLDWLKLTNFERNDHSLKVRAVPKPGNVLLPPMGFCDIHEASRDVRTTHINTHRFICEISPHVLYQYVMLVFWFLLVFGMVLSILGIFLHAISYVFSYLAIRSHDHSGRMYKSLTFREVDYLDYLRQKNAEKYNDIVKKIRENAGLFKESDRNENIYKDSSGKAFI